MYAYFIEEEGSLEENPALSIKSPKKEKNLPKYLTEDESIRLLNAIDGRNKERDYCMITFLLNCGMRLSELIGINVSDIKDDRSLVIKGKGNKERLIYLNNACMSAFYSYIPVREMTKGKDGPALFLSSQGERITSRAARNIVEKHIDAAGLSGRGISPHKLRHTAATLMYQEGGVDVLVLKDILGHENLSTTQVYTHIGSGQVKDAMLNSPLSKL